MGNILFATDLSTSSISAMNFAYNLSQVNECKLIVVHVYQVVKPKNWRLHRFEDYEKTRREFLLNKLNKFLSKGLKTDHTLLNIEIHLKAESNVVNSIINSASQFQCDFICVNTRGKSNAIIGTTASKLIVASPVPVVSIPSRQSVKKLTNVCYASNMVNYQKEIKKVIAFAEPLDATVSMLHIADPEENFPKFTAVETRLLKKTERKIKVKYVKRNPENTLCEDINSAVKKIKPDLIVFFIHRSQSYWNAMFHPSNITPLSFYAKIPILSFKK